MTDKENWLARQMREAAKEVEAWPEHQQNMMRREVASVTTDYIRHEEEIL